MVPEDSAFQMLRSEVLCASSADANATEKLLNFSVVQVVSGKSILWYPCNKF